MYLGQIDPVLQTAVRQSQQSAQLPVPRTERGTVDWHAISAMTGALLAMVTIWQVLRMESRRRR